MPYQYEPSITLGQAVARNFDFHIRRVWVWAGVAVVCAWIVGLNILIIFAMQFFPRRPHEVSLKDGSPYIHLVSDECCEQNLKSSSPTT